MADHRVVEEFGVLAEPLGEAEDGVEGDAGEAGGGAAADPLGEVAGDGDEGVFVGAQAEQGVLARSEKCWPQVEQRRQRTLLSLVDQPRGRRLAAPRRP